MDKIYGGSEKTFGSNVTLTILKLAVAGPTVMFSTKQRRVSFIFLYIQLNYNLKYSTQGSQCAIVVMT